MEIAPREIGIGHEEWAPGRLSQRDRLQHRYGRTCPWVAGDDGGRRDKRARDVGTLALDSSGMIVAGTSTSGWAMRLPGRVSDSSVIGAGNYANEAGASSSTGLGEYAIRHNLTRKVCDRLGVGYQPTEACEETLKEMLRREKVGFILALIALDRHGQVGGATTKESFIYQYQRLSDRSLTRVTPTPVSV